MGNTSQGAKRAVRTKRKKYGPEAMEKWGRKGGQELWRRIKHGGLRNPL